MSAYLEELKRTHTPKLMYAVAMYIFKSDELKILEEKSSKVIVSPTRNQIMLTHWWPKEEIAKKILESEIKYDIMDKCNVYHSFVIEDIKWYRSMDAADNDIPYETLKYVMPDLSAKDSFTNYVGLALINTLMYIKKE